MAERKILVVFLKAIVKSQTLAFFASRKFLL